MADKALPATVGSKPGKPVPMQAMKKGAAPKPKKAAAKKGGSKKSKSPY